MATNISNLLVPISLRGVKRMPGKNRGTKKSKKKKNRGMKRK